MARYLDLPERPELPERPPKYRKNQRIIGKIEFVIIDRDVYLHITSM